MLYKSCSRVLILQKDQQNQIPPLSPDTFLDNKILSTASVNVKNLGRPLLWGTVCFYPRSISKCSFAKGFNPNLEADSQNQSIIAKPPDDTVTWAPLSHKTRAVLNVRVLIGRKCTKAIHLEKLTVSNHSTTWKSVSREAA